jgi:leucyl-tRNA synthetase
VSTKGTIKDVWAVHEKRKERVKLMQREWVKRNRDKANAYRAATKERKRSVVLMTTAPTNNAVVKSRYRTDFRNTIYHCPELTYRGKND